MNKTKDLPVCTTANIADSFWARFRGLLGKRSLDTGSGLLLVPSAGVHTFGMQFPIDVVSLDKDLCVLGIWEGMQPGKMRLMSLKTHSILELSCGHSQRCKLAVGDQLTLHRSLQA